MDARGTENWQESQIPKRDLPKQTGPLTYYQRMNLLLYCSLRGGNVFEELRGIFELTLNNFATFQCYLMVIAFKPFFEVYLNYEVFISDIF